MLRAALLACAMLLPVVARAQIFGGGPTLGTLPGQAVPAGGAADALTVLSRNEAARASDTINVKDAPCNATGNGSTDDSAAIAACITYVNTLRSGSNLRVKLYFPPGFYYIKSTALPSFLYAGQVYGEYHQSYILVDPAYSGDVFSWSEAWMSGTTYTPPLLMTTDRAGPSISNMIITGTPGGSAQQNALMFYDRDDHVSVNSVHVFGMPGRCIGMGLPKAQALSFTRESSFRDMKCWNTGAVQGTQSIASTVTAGSTSVTGMSTTTGVSVGMSIAPGSGIPDGDEVASVASGTSITMTLPATASGTPNLSISTVIPAVEITSTGSGDTSNQLKWFGLDVCGYAGSGVVIRSQNTSGKAISQINFFAPRVEACGSNAAGDQYQIGDTGAAYVGRVSDTGLSGFVANSSTAGYATFGIYANSLTQQPYGIYAIGTIPTGAGIGLNVMAGRNMQFHVADMGTTGTALVVGSTALVGVNNQFDGFGAEQSWTKVIDVSNRVQLPIYTTSTNSLVARSSGAFGELNTPGQYGFATGNNGLDFGIYSFGWGNLTDGRAWANAMCHDDAAFSAGDRGDTEDCWQTLVGTSTGSSTAQLTEGGISPNIANILNLNFGANGTALSETCRADINVMDKTAGTMASWQAVIGAIRPGTATTVSVPIATFTSQSGSNSTIAGGVTFAAAADSTRSGITLNATVSGITDTLYYTAPFHCTQTQHP